MKDQARSDAPKGSIDDAVEAFRRGFQPVPIRNGGKRPYGSSWTHIRWDDEEQVREAFAEYAAKDAGGIGLLLGEASGGLIDIDLDHPKALRLRDHFLPPSRMQTGRAGRPRSHRWYRVTENLPGTRRYKMPDGSVSVELRSTSSQTVIPPTIHPSGEEYRWEGTPWGGSDGPAVVDGKKLAIQVALLGMGTVLLESWPKKGGRHEAYLALAGGLLRYGESVHPYWERNLPVLIGALADVSGDEDGAEARTSETMGSTVTRLREGGTATGFTRLAELIGNEAAELTRRMAREVESLSGFTSTPSALPAPSDTPDEIVISELPPEERNPLAERVSSWAALDLEPYLTGEVVMPDPSLLVRSDGKGLMYPGRVNSLFGKSESAKSWIALWACMQEMGKGDRVIYIDLEDGPEGTLDRLKRMGAGADDVKNQFRYVSPDGPLAEMQRYRHGAQPTTDGKASSEVFTALVETFDPTLIVADGMTTLYGLHGHDTNEATATEVITGWLKKMCRGGRSTVIVIDHTGKGGGAGSSPIGAHHKIAMVQGTALRVDVVDRPMQDAVGTMNLVVFKDRPGAVRKESSKGDEQIAGRVVLDSTEDNRSRISIEPPDPDDVVVGNSPGMERKLAHLAERSEQGEQTIAMFGGDPEKRVTTPDLVKKFGVSASEAREIWEALQSRNLVDWHGVGRGRYYTLRPT